MTQQVTTDEVLDMLVERLTVVLGLDAGTVDPAARFDEDLHADSLDLVEVIEAVERELERRGLHVRLSDDELAALETVGEAAERIAGRVHG